MAALKKKGTRKPTLIKVADVDTMATEYANISEQIKALDKRKKELSELLKDAAGQIGTLDDRGSFYVDTDSFVVGKVLKVQMPFNNDKAVAYCNEHGLKDYVHQIITYKVDEKEIANLVTKGEIDLEEVEKNFYDRKDSFSVSVKAKEVAEEMPEVEVSDLKAAKRK